MLLLPTTAFFIALRLAAAHGDHGEPAPGETVQEYAQRHMASEHHIDSFDVASFFQLHDLNRDGILDRDEIEAIYGVHHVYSQKKSKDDVDHQNKADTIVNTVLKLIDKNADGKITLEEFTAVGLEGLPNFDSLGAEGHHYDVESEFFLHHEEQFHSTPETQTDEAYNHPEDIEHFAAHESIERQEAEREAVFQGITVDEALAQHEPHAEPPAPAGGAQAVLDEPAPGAGPVSAAPPKISRAGKPSDDPAVRFSDVRGGGEWGGDGGYKAPRSPSDKLKKNLPYKYKFRRTWGDF